ncbi:MAG: hypothetical protein KAR83_05070 [Thermodesulfovibrionales bacterium]|nr:hypothetical protein [Thermodesulfovibrionales bacterium]
MSEDIISEAYAEVTEFARQKYEKAIDTAYDFFWEEEDPMDMMGGSALELGFINFEDWLVCDYRPEEKSPGFIDLFLHSENPSDEIKEVLEKLKVSYISLYEVKKAGNPVVLSDIATGDDDFEVNDEQLSHLEKGYAFAARFIETDGERKIGRSVYPFGIKMKDEILKLINAQFARYKKNKNSEGTMKDFLVDESYAFNMTWMSCLQRPKK